MFVRPLAVMLLLLWTPQFPPHCRTIKGFLFYSIHKMEILTPYYNLDSWREKKNKINFLPLQIFLALKMLESALILRLSQWCCASCYAFFQLAMYLQSTDNDIMTPGVGADWCGHTAPKRSKSANFITQGNIYKCVSLWPNWGAEPWKADNKHGL